MLESLKQGTYIYNGKFKLFAESGFPGLPLFGSILDGHSQFEMSSLPVSLDRW